MVVASNRASGRYRTEIEITRAINDSSTGDSSPLIKSGVLPDFFARIDKDQPVSIFDAGPAAAKSLDFFNQFKSHIYVADLYDSLPVLDEGYGELADQHKLSLWEKHFRGMLSLKKGVRFDLFLFWDIPCLLDRFAMQALLKVLSPAITGSSYAHCFAFHSARHVSTFHRYALENETTIHAMPIASVERGKAIQNQKDVERIMHLFTVTTSVLHANGKVEIGLKGSPAGS